MPILTSQQRKILEDACTKGRRTSEQAVRAALTALDIKADRPPAHLSEEEKELRRGLRAKARQLGDAGTDKFDLLVADCAYEQWHWLLFARFLAENSLLIHPEYRAPVTLDDCDELAESLGEPDGWSVAGRFAAEILPGIFRLDDPCVRIRLAPEGRLSLENIIAGLPAEVFTCEDALGWVYQFWQKDKKDEVNAAERKIGGADLGPVTQLFTENYMVRFLLENSLGAWWAAHHPHSPIIRDFEYLRFGEDGLPSTGTLDHWPGRVQEITVMDPCCGSGHFLVAAFGMLWRMRAEEEGLPPVDAQDAVLRDNLFGLELDPRCVQIAMFAVAMSAWIAGGGWRKLPIPNIACAGIPIRANVDEWRALADGDERLENALARMHVLFRDADTLGSLIDPQRLDRLATQATLDEMPSDELLAGLERAINAETTRDPASRVLGAEAAAGVRALTLLQGKYVLVATNPPFLGRGLQDETLRRYCLSHYPLAEPELANVLAERWSQASATAALVLPHGWLFMSSFSRLREHLLANREWLVLARLGHGAFGTISGQVVQVALWIGSDSKPKPAQQYREIVAAKGGPSEKADMLRYGEMIDVSQLDQLSNPESIVVSGGALTGPFVSDIAEARAGLGTGDDPSFVRYFWEVPSLGTDWEYLQSAPSTSSTVSGCQKVILWEQERGRLAQYAESVRHLNTATQGWRRGKPIWGRRGVVVKLMGDLHIAPYYGHRYDRSCAAVVPLVESDLGALWQYAASGEMEAAIRSFHTKLSVETGTLLSAPIKLEHWRHEAAKGDGLPKPEVSDPTQWLFGGCPNTATAPLQVATARLLGYRWPEQPPSDALDGFADNDGIACLASAAGEPPAAERIRAVLATAFGDSWSPAKLTELLEMSGSKKKNLDDWLRDDFFKQHCALFENRPFVWHIWDGQRGGFAALVNYHKLNRKTLEKLAYTYLGDWIERQRAEVRDEVAGAEARLAAASNLRKSLELILDGEPPHDIYARWKDLAEQPVGWDPDFNDGIRVNVRPFVQAGVLRSTVNIHWGKDRGKNPDGSERLNDLHFTTLEKQLARGGEA